jgi:hypothetical protein
MEFEDTMDMYREAFDIHGEDVKCHTCGVTMDELTVQHYVNGKCDCPEDHDFPQCDRCYWNSYYATHDPDTSELLECETD